MSFRDAFQPYIDHPERFGQLILYQDDQVLIIKDKFPKSLRHYLIIPRSSTYTRIHPLKVFYQFPKLYDILTDYVALAKQLIVDDLINVQLIAPNQGPEFKSLFIQCGVHSIPSLNNLHIHVMTKDFHSPRLKHKKHYNSFNTKFFVPFEELNPVVDNSDSSNATVYSDDTQYSDSDSQNSQHDLSQHQHEIDHDKLEELIKKTPLICSYCQKSFGNSFVKLKQHLSLEFSQKFPHEANTSPNGW